jgi:acetylglutamate kinase
VSRLVVKVGGAVARARPALEVVQELAATGHELVVVHGAGPQISQEMERFGLDVRFVGGRRVTSKAALALVRRSLEEVNRTLCDELGPAALGLFGDEIGLHATQVAELGFVGDPLPCGPRAVEQALTDKRIPVVAPLGVGPLNVNADEAAVALAVGLDAHRILFVTDVPGVLVEGSLVERLAAGEADRLLDCGAFEGGIVPKLRAAVRAARLGVRAEIGETAVVA